MNPLLAAATDREPVRPGDARSGATFERFRVGAARYFVKRVSPARDWILRATGDRDFRMLKVWRAGLMHRAAPVVEHAVVDVEVVDDELVVVMRDVGEQLVPDGDGPIDLDGHRALLAGMAAFAGEFWGWRDDVGLMPLADRFVVFAPGNITGELTRPDPSPVLQAADTGWGLLDERSPELASLARAVHARPAALAAALDRTPRTFLHGDWKMSNLGWCPDGRTVLLDWSFLGAGPVCWELGWYLALNRARLPEPKEDAVAAFRAAVGRRGLDPDGWFDRQLTLCLFAIAATFGWEKALGGDAELDWWAHRADVGAALLDREEPRMALTDHYAGAAEGWASGAARVYGPLAVDLVAAAPHPLAGRRVLDAGAGTGLASRALLRAGAQPVAVDLSLEMLRWRRAERPPAAVGELGRIPLRSGSVDDAVAAFVLNHLPEPESALRELARVVRPGGAVLATVYANSFVSPLRDRIDEIAFVHGFAYPRWYRELKASRAPLLGSEELMAAAARAAGLWAPQAVEYRADLGLDRAEDLVDYRLGQAHIADWISGLSPARRAALRTAAIAAVGPIMQPYRPGVVRLVAVVP